MKFLTREEYHTKIGEKGFIGKEKCPFCEKEKNKSYIVWEGKFWYILRNFSPYTGDENHLMVVPYEHIVFSKDLTENHFLELKEIHNFMFKYFEQKDYFSFTREGFILLGEKASGRSVEHLHMHFLPGQLKGKYLRYMLMKQGFPIKQEL